MIKKNLRLETISALIISLYEVKQKKELVEDILKSVRKDQKRDINSQNEYFDTDKQLYHLSLALEKDEKRLKESLFQEGY